MLPERIKRPEAKQLAQEEFERYSRLISDLSDEELGQTDGVHRVGRSRDVAARPRVR